MHHVLLLGVHDCPITRTIPLPDWSIMTNERINCWQPGSKKRFRCQLIESDSGHETHGDLRKRYRTDRHRDHQHDDGPRTRADDGIRTRDPHLGKVMLYQLSHVRNWLSPELF